MTAGAAAQLAARKLQHRADLHEVRLDGELVVYDLRTGSLHQLDAIGAMTWDLLDGTDALARALPRIAATFGTDVEIVATDLLRLVGELDAVGLLISD